MNKSSKRYHGLDFLRAAMMLMGIILHVGIIYMPIPWGTNIELILADFKNPYRDLDSFSQTIQRLIFFIHYFRMPAFMMLAGFFAALVQSKRGTTSLVKNRIQRIVLPAVLFWFLLWPMDSYAWSLGAGLMIDTDHSQSIAQHLINTLSVEHLPFFGEGTLHTMHLWFLYYLIMFYGFTFLGLAIVRSCFPSVPAKVIAYRDAALNSNAKHFILPSIIMLSWATLRTGVDWHFMAAFRFSPDLACFLNHYFFFLIGWLFYGSNGVITHLTKKGWTYLAFGIATAIALTWSSERFFDLFMASPLSADETASMDLYFNISQFLQAACVWLLMLGFVGLSERYITKATPLCTYLVGTSYWLYLIHRPLCTGIAACFDRVDLPGIIKAGIVSVLVSIVCLLSYHYLVRNSWIGVLLNGKRADTQP